MSHFSVMAVIRKEDFEKRAKIRKMTKELEGKAEDSGQEKDEAAREDAECTEDELIAMLAPYDEGDGEEVIEKTHDELLQEAKDAGQPLDEYIEEYYGEDAIDEDGNYVRYVNEDAKWDYWIIGGRWSDYLRLKNGKKADIAYVKDIDFSINKEEYKAATRWWEVVVEGSPLAEGEDEKQFHTFYKKEYLINRYKDKEGYAKTTATFSTYAVLDSDGWHGRGEMGWFGISMEEKEDWEANFHDAFIKDLNPDDLIVIIDCHI